jgi:hypothetical protein
VLRDALVATWVGCVVAHSPRPPLLRPLRLPGEAHPPRLPPLARRGALSAPPPAKKERRTLHASPRCARCVCLSCLSFFSVLFPAFTRASSAAYSLRLVSATR